MLALGCMVSPAMAAVSESNRGTALRIDNQTQYMGMDSTYKDGYSPTVADNQANIILPLIASGGAQQVKAGEPINISVNLGDPQKAPFVFNNYNEKVTLENNKLADGTVNPAVSYTHLDVYKRQLLRRMVLSTVSALKSLRKVRVSKVTPIFLISSSNKSFSIFFVL